MAAKKRATRKGASAGSKTRKSVKDEKGGRSKPRAAKKKPAGRKSPSAKAAEPKQTTPTAPDGTADCPVVGIGASAGGLEAFKQFLTAMPPDSGMAFVLIQHLDPKHESMMAELLSRYTSMEVVQVEDGMAVAANRVYMIPPNSYLTLSEGCLRLSEPTKQRGMRMPIDYFFRSLAGDRKEKSICVILSGTGSDGTMGLKAVKGAGGMAMAQEPGSASYDGMPRSAVSTGLVDFVLPVKEMADVLVRYARHPYLKRGGRESPLAEASPDHFKAVLAILRSRTDLDFRPYKKGTIHRRIERRMGLRHIDQLGDYVKVLRQDPAECRALSKDLLIGVTSFFRDLDAFETLQEEVLGPIVRENRLNDPVRVWMPGCTTGEEAYSIAIMLCEEFAKEKKDFDVQIFATDIDEEAVESARAGRYPLSVAADVSTKRLQQFFVEEGDCYQVSKKLRESVVFAVQNLIADPPFSKLDLICCRNLLIYLEADVQDKVVQLMHFALRDGGYLFLGSSESIGRHTDLFHPISKGHRIYQKVGKSIPGRANFPIAPADEQAFAKDPVPATPAADQPRALPDVARKIMLDRFAPASVIINRSYDVLFFHGPTRNYLDYPSGEPTRDLTALCMEGLRNKLRAAVHQATNENRCVSTTARRVKRNGNHVSVRLTVEPIHVPGIKGGLLLVSFEDTPHEAPPRKRADGEKPGDDPGLVRQLEYELQATREDLQSTIEELETSNEELKASNEEVMSMNEELQSTNEELETSREELQSLNEELSTVNNQLEEKVHELEATNNDLTNLLNSTEIATIFLDSDFRIRRFTPATKGLVNLIASDVGRPFSDIAPRFTDAELLPDAKEVLESLASVEREIQNGGDRWYIRRVMPYRTSDNRIEGVVITFTDVTEIKAATELVRARERQQAVVAELGRRALTGLDEDELFQAVADNVAEVLHVDFCEVLQLLPDGRRLLLRAGVGWNEGSVGTATVPAGLDSLAGYTLEGRKPVIVEDFSREKRFVTPPLLAEHDAASGLTVIIGQPDGPYGVLGAQTRRKAQFTVDDVNFLQSVANVLGDALQRAEADRACHESEERLRLALECGHMGAWEWDPESGRSVWTPRMFEMLGLSPKEVQPTTEAFFECVHPDDRPALRQAVDAALQRNEPYRCEFRVVWPDGTVRWLAVDGSVVRDPGGRSLRMTGVNFDVTPAKEAEEKLANLNETLEDRVAERTAQLRELAAELTRAEQRERKRLATKLHDDLQQLLVAAKLKIGRIGKGLDKRTAGILHSALGLVDQAIDASRSLGTEIRPPVLRDAGLVEALEWLGRQSKDQHGLEVVVTAEGPPAKLDEDARVVIFQAVRELLFNVVKHAGTGRARVKVTFQDGLVALCVEDDGKGFSPKALERRPGERGGFGLLNVRERMEALGGSFRIQTAPGRGACLCLDVPVATAEPTPDGETEPLPMEVDKPKKPTPRRRRPRRGAVRILLVDDHTVVREGLVSILNQQTSFSVVGEASDGEEALRLCNELEPDVVVMDITMPKLNGIEATRRLKKGHPNTAVVALSLHEEEELVAAILKAGAATYVAKDGPSEGLFTAIRTAHRSAASSAKP